jgi:hypothetical protein
MSYSRRKFIKAGILAAACAGLPLKSVLGRSGTGKFKAALSSTPTFNPASLSDTSTASIDQLGYYSKAAFTPYVNTRFRIYLGASNTRSLQLIDVGDYLNALIQADASASAPGNECFSLLFQVPFGKPFNQDTYMIEHDALGTFYMFVAPVGAHSKKDPADYYEAVIYRRPQSVETQAPMVVNDTETNTTVAPTTTQGPWRVSGVEGTREVFTFGALLPPQPDVSGKLPERPAAVEATWMTMAQDKGINGIKLGMTAEQVLALFPGSLEDEKIRASLSRPSDLGLSSLMVKPQKYSSKADFEGINQIVLTLLDGRVSTLYVGYEESVAKDLDESVTKFSKGRKLPSASSWKVYEGLDDQLKTMKCKDFEISVFAGGENVPVNYVQMVDMKAQQKLKERKAKLKKRK